MQQRSLSKFNSWREGEGLDAADALGSNTTCVLESSNLSQERLAQLAQRRPQLEEEEGEPERAPLQRSNTASSNQSGRILRSNSQSQDYIADGMDAADAAGVDGLGEEIPAYSDSDAVVLEEEAEEQQPPHTNDEEKGEEAVKATPTPAAESCAKREHSDSASDYGEEAATGEGFRHTRFIPRDGVFGQASFKLNVRNRVSRGDHASYSSYLYLVYKDWFDALLGLQTWKILGILWVVYTLQMLLFGLFYYAASIDCVTTEAMSFAHSFAFSLEISTSLGFTLPQANSVMFFNGCGSWIIIIYFQCLVGLLFNGIILGTIMIRFSRADRRAVQVVFSEKACVTCIQGRFYLTFQCFDLQAANSMVSSTVRMLAIFHELKPNQPGALWQTRAMRLIRPNDEIGSKLWLSIPCIVMHEIDCWSPLAPGAISRPPKIPFGTAPNRFPQTAQRSVDGRQGSRCQCTCVVCGSMYLTDSALRRHITYCAEKERTQKRTQGGHIDLDTRKLTRPVVTRTATQDQTSFFTVTPEETRDAIAKRFKQRNIEIVCLVEGTDTMTANSFQARHSYCYQDIEYDSQHSSCLGVGKDGGVEVNLSDFHKTWKGDSNFEEAIGYPSFT